MAYVSVTAHASEPFLSVEQCGTDPALWIIEPPHQRLTMAVQCAIEPSRFSMGLVVRRVL